MSSMSEVGHAAHAGHGTDHTGHEQMFRTRFWWSLLLTIPMARLVDWLVARDRRRYLAGDR